MGFLGPDCAAAMFCVTEAVGTLGALHLRSTMPCSVAFANLPNHENEIGLPTRICAIDDWEACHERASFQLEEWCPPQLRVKGALGWAPLSFSTATRRWKSSRRADALGRSLLLMPRQAADDCAASTGNLTRACLRPVQRLGTWDLCETPFLL